MVGIDHGGEKLRGGNAVFSAGSEAVKQYIPQSVFQCGVGNGLQFAVNGQVNVLAGDGICGADDAHTTAFFVDFDGDFAVGAVQILFIKFFDTSLTDNVCGAVNRIAFCVDNILIQSNVRLGHLADIANDL